MNKDAVAEMSQQYQVEATEKLVPEGYKQTEVGVIPEDWKTVELGDLLSYEQPTRYLVNSSDYLETGTVPVLTAGKTFILGYTSELDNLYTNLPVIIFDDFTTGSQYVDFPFKAKSSAMKMLRPRNEQIPLQLVYSALNSVDFIIGDHKRHWISEFSKLKIAWPATNEEQTAIANALSDVDALLSELEKLIAKKQAIKTATMQQLLTGRTRLPQFAHHPDGSKKGYKQSELGEIPEDWLEFSLSELCDVRDGTHESPKYQEHGVPLVTSKNIVNDRLDLSNVSLISVEDALEVNKRSKVNLGDIIMSMIGTVGSAVLIDKEPKFCIKNVALFKPKKVKGEFLIQLIRSVFFQEYLEDSIDGGIQKFVSLGTLRNMNLVVPDSFEQTAIATILSDMDAEIQALEQRLNKTRQIKQGMMQQLLTGKIRLV